MKKILAGKKRFTILLLVVALCISAISAAEEANPKSYLSNDFEYVLLENGTAEIIKYFGLKETLIIPDHLDGYEVTGIGASAFERNWYTSPASITIPDNIVRIEGNPFFLCSELTTIIVSPDHPYLEMVDGVLFSKPDKRLIFYPSSLKASEYSIPQGIQIIGGYAFAGCDLTRVTIPDSVTRIEEHAFEYCYSLTDVTIPNSVIRIEEYAFSYCSSLTGVTIPGNVAEIGDNAFASCGLTSVTIPDSVTSIGNNAFAWCSKLTSVTIPDSVTSIGDNAFDSCKLLTTIIIPDSVTSMGDNPFPSCIALTTIIVSPDHPYLATIDGVLFSKPDKRLICYPCTFTESEYAIPQGIQIIGGDAFVDSCLTSVTIPEGVTSIGDDAFEFCTKLTSVTLPASLTSIGSFAFNSCESLTDMIIPDGVTSIGNGAFKDCECLKNFLIPNSVTSIDGNPFFGSCEIIVSPDHPYLEMIDGVLFSKPDKRLVCYYKTTGRTEYSVPEGTRIIGDYAFSCDGLSSINIPDSVTSIGEVAFRWSSLTDITIPEGVTSIGEWAFFAGTSLDSVTLPASVSYIGENAFEWLGPMIFVPRGSYAADYCKKNGYEYYYTDANDWLNN